MPQKPSADVRIDASLVRRLLTQAGDAYADLEIAKASEGWDCEVWRLGARLAMRMPRRAAAAVLVAHEHAALPLVGPAIEATGVRVPTPVFLGHAAEDYPWAWSIVPWIDGVSGLEVPRAERGGWTQPLAHALAALHVVAPDDAPANPVRGVPFAQRDAAVTARFRSLRAHGGWPVSLLDAAESVWRSGMEAPAWHAAPLWLHGDLHPGNLVARGGGLAGIIDFGDVTAGDPAYDLGIAWLAFAERDRDAFRAATDDRYDAATWVRARAWAAAVAVLLASHSDDDEDFLTMAGETLHEVSLG